MLANQWGTNVAEPYINTRKQLTQDSTSTLKSLENIVAGGEGKKYMDQLRIYVNEFTSAEKLLMLSRKQDSEQTSSSAINIALYATLITIILGLLITFVISKSILNQLTKLVDAIKTVALGDLTVDIMTTNDN